MVPLLPTIMGTNVPTVWPDLSIFAVVVFIQIVLYKVGHSLIFRFEETRADKLVMRYLHRSWFTVLVSFGVIWILEWHGGQILELLLKRPFATGGLALIGSSPVLPGLIVVFTRPYDIGDLVELPPQGTRAVVTNITFFNTTFRTFDNTEIRVANKKVRNTTIINTNKKDELRRRAIKILVTYESNIELSQSLIECAAEAVDEVSSTDKIGIGGISLETGPKCNIVEFADSGILLELLYWVNEPVRIKKVESEIMTNINLVFQNPSVSFAYPHLHVFSDNNTEPMEINLH